MSRRETSAPLAVNPHWYREQADENVQAADGAEDLERSLLLDESNHISTYESREDNIRVWAQTVMNDRRRGEGEKGVAYANPI